MACLKANFTHPSKYDILLLDWEIETGVKMGIKQFIAKSFFDFAYAIAYRPVSSSSKAYLKGEASFKLLRPTLRYWYADPLLAKINDTEYLFMEVYDRKKHKGLIGVSSFTKDGTLTTPRIILEEEFHLSFPLVFDYNGRTILMPECSESESLRFYELDKNTLAPTLIRNIPTEGRIVDTVLLDMRPGQITLLGCKEDDNPIRTSLVCMSISDLENGDIQYLPLPREYETPSLLLRNGGPILHSGQTKIRILQESTETEYGHNLLFRKIENDGLGDGTYHETDLEKVFLKDLPLRLPSYYRRQGTHTYSLGENAEVIDVSFNRFHIGNLWMK